MNKTLDFVSVGNLTARPNLAQSTRYSLQDAIKTIYSDRSVDERRLPKIKRSLQQPQSVIKLSSPTSEGKNNTFFEADDSTVLFM